ncbi:MAG: ABC transporter permease [Lentisphaerales bacterium]|nr:ABC transporter permease [Lentisphaerales bacterium]
MKQKIINFFEATGLTWFVPITRLISGEEPAEQCKEIAKMLGYPAIAMILFFTTWGYLSTKIKTSVGALPSPFYVWSQAGAMWDTHNSETVRKTEAEGIEQTRQKFDLLVKERRQLEDSNSSTEAVDKKLKALLEATKNKVDSYTPLIEKNTKIKEDAEKVKTEEIAAIRKKYTDAKSFDIGEDGKPKVDVDGNPKLSVKALDEINYKQNFRVAVYQSNLAEVYKSTQGSYKSLVSKIERIEKYTAMARELALIEPSTGHDKKVAANDKKRQAFEKQIAKPIEYQGNGSIIDYIELSIITVVFGFFLAAFVAIPLGILCGLSPAIMTALNPLIQTFRPVSPLAWVLITIQVIDGIFVGDNALTGDVLKNTFLHAGITVALCSMWATLSNTALGVSSVDADHMNVAKVLKLNWFDRIFKIIVPSAIPYIFTGLRITLGVGWMVLIVSEMMATSRGLGWYIDQEYQNNKVESLANIIVCIFIIGLIGFVLDRIMFVLQKLVSFNDEVSA